MLFIVVLVTAAKVESPLKNVDELAVPEPNLAVGTVPDAIFDASRFVRLAPLIAGKAPESFDEELEDADQVKVTLSENVKILKELQGEKAYEASNENLSEKPENPVISEVENKNKLGAGEEALELLTRKHQALKKQNEDESLEVQVEEGEVDLFADELIPLHGGENLVEDEKEEYFSTYLYNLICTKLGRKFKNILRIYANGQTAGQCGNPHTDDGDITILYYPNPDWQMDYHGHLIFSGDGNSPTHIIEYKPDRMVMFPAKMVHYSEAPHRFYQGLRISLAYKLEV